MTGAGWLARMVAVPAGLAADGPQTMLVAELAGKEVTRRDHDTALPLAATEAGTFAGPAAVCAAGAEVVVLDVVSARVVTLDDRLALDGPTLFLRDHGARRPIGMCLIQ